jgi:hypothetical protein
MSQRGPRGWATGPASADHAKSKLPPSDSSANICLKSASGDRDRYDQPMPDNNADALSYSRCGRDRRQRRLSPAFWPRWRSRWSASTMASMASAMGVARMPTQGSWRPLVTTSVAARQVHRAPRQPDAGGGLQRQARDDALAGGDAAEHAAGVVGQEAVGVISSRCSVPFCATQRSRRRSRRP